LAKIIANKCKAKCRFVQLSATSSGVNDVKEVIKKAKNDQKMLRKRTILFLDEIHRFNKLQQVKLLTCLRMEFLLYFDYDSLH